MEHFDTIPALFQHVTHTYHHATALNLRQDDAWQNVSTESFTKRVRRMALGLKAMGLKPGQSVGILAESSPWWLMADLAILIAGGVSVPLFTTSSVTNLKYKIRHADIRLTFICGDKAVQRFRTGGCRRLFSRTIVHGAGTSRGSFISDDSLMQYGDELSIKDPTLFAKMCSRAKPDDIATIIYTSGTSGRPKGVSLTHRNVVSQIHAAGQWFDFNAADDRALSILPLAHAFERMVTYFCLSRGVSLWFANPAQDLPETLAHVKPTAVAVVPRVLEKIYTSIVAKVESAGMLRKPLGRWAIRLAHARNGNGHSTTLSDRLAESLVYARMRHALGGHLRTLICGGAPLSPRLCRFFMNIGVPIYQGYGLTEASPVITGNHPGHNRVGTVGQAIPGVELRIGDHDEVLARGPNIMAGYHRDPRATAQMIDADGWLHTGDQGQIDEDGYLTITGRIKDLCKTAGGKYVSPAPIEQALTASPLIDQACVFADARPYPCCLIFPDTAYLRKAMGPAVDEEMSDDELLELPEVKQQIERVLERINEKLEPWERIRNYRLVAGELSVDNGSLTPTQKLRRQQIQDEYRDIIETMYNGSKTGLPSDPDGDTDHGDDDRHGRADNMDVDQTVATDTRKNNGKSNGNGRHHAETTPRAKEKHDEANRDH